MDPFEWWEVRKQKNRETKLNVSIIIRCLSLRWVQKAKKSIKIGWNASQPKNPKTNKGNKEEKYSIIQES